MLVRLVRSVTVAAVRECRAAAVFEEARPWWTRAVLVLELAATPMAQAALVAAVVFMLWTRVDTAEVGRPAAGWRYVHITWQTPDTDEPIWSSTAGPFRWETAGRIEARWGRTQWSTTGLTAVA